MTTSELFFFTLLARVDLTTSSRNASLRTYFTMLGFGGPGGVCVRQGGGVGGGGGREGGGGWGGEREDGSSRASPRTCDRDGERPVLVLAGDYIASTHVVLRGAYSLVQVPHKQSTPPFHHSYFTHGRAL